MLRAAIAQFRPDKGNYAANLQRVGELFAEIARSAEPPALLLFPEAALTGYFLEGGVQELALPVEKLFDDLARLHAASGAPPLDVAIVFYEVWRNHLHNSALYASLGGEDAGIRHVHRKVFLPTYGVFDEERFVEPGRTVEAFDTRWGRAAMPEKPGDAARSAPISSRRSLTTTTPAASSTSSHATPGMASDN
jgi:predicted amidohydrolase